MRNSGESRAISDVTLVLDLIYCWAGAHLGDTQGRPGVRGGECCCRFVDARPGFATIEVCAVI